MSAAAITSSPSTCPIPRSLRARRPTRVVRIANRGNSAAPPEVAVMPAELWTAIVLFGSLLDERQRRPFAGLDPAVSSITLR